MVSIQVFTAARMAAIEAKAIIAAAVDAAGNLTFTKFDGTIYGPWNIKGPTGNAGAAGSKQHQGTGAPAGTLGVVGDWYLNTSNGDYYEKTGASAWTLRINLKGPAGTNGNALSAYPVGSIFIASVSTNPATLLGGGTWARWGQGRVPVSQDGADVDFDTAEEVGGAKTHTLTTAEIPSHSHAIKYMPSEAATGTAKSIPHGSGTSTYASNDSGGGGAHNNLQPYIVCYMWKRTA